MVLWGLCLRRVMLFRVGGCGCGCGIRWEVMFPLLGAGRVLIVIGVLIDGHKRLTQSCSSDAGGRCVAAALFVLGRRRRKKCLRFCFGVFGGEGCESCSRVVGLFLDACVGKMKSCENRSSIFSVVAFPKGRELVGREKKSMVFDCGMRDVRIVKIAAGKFRDNEV